MTAIENLVPSVRLERTRLAAPASETGASTNSATRGLKKNPMRLGVTGRDRTGIFGITTRSSAIELRPHPNALDEDGLGGRVRTADLMLPKHPRYQLRYTEKKNADAT